MKLRQTIFLIVFITSSLSAQHYITTGIGITGSPFSSDKMDKFRKTYNETNLFVLTQKFDGFAFGLGIRPEFGYRYIDEYSAAALISYQTLTDFDVANFSSGDTRKLTMDLTAFYFECEFGYNWGDYFTNGLVGIYFNRQITIKNTYQTDDPDFVSSFTGTFKTDPATSADIGIAVGMVKSSFIIILKAAYPLYTGGESNFLIDSKQEEDLKRFPADYFNYSQNNSYAGVTSDIDGIKFTLTFSYAFKLNNQ